MGGHLTVAGVCAKRYVSISLRAWLCKQTSQFINLASHIDSVRLQHFQGVSPVAPVLKLNNSFVEGVQIVFQPLNFVLYWK
jgi:hypothetical protein